MSDNEVFAAVMNQLPDASIPGYSPLHHADLESLAKQGPQQGGVHLREHALLGHLVLRCNPENPEHLAGAERVLGVALPLQPMSSVTAGNVSVLWTSPDEWVIMVPGLEAFDYETKFRAEMAGHYSLVNVSGGQTLVEVSGANVVDMLKKSTPLDFDLSVFPVGKVAGTVFAKAGAVVRRTGEDRFELIIRRSFADYLWLWLQDASREYGLVIEA